MSYVLQSLTNITLANVNFKCTAIKQKWFNKTKHIVSHGNILAHKYFNNNFDIHTNARSFQLGVVIS